MYYGKEIFNILSSVEVYEHMATEKDGSKKERKREIAEPPVDDPLLRAEKGILDKTIGSETEDLAEKRLAAIKRAHEMESSERTSAVGTSDSPSGEPGSSPQVSRKWIQLGPTHVPLGQTYSPHGTRVNVTGRVTVIVPDPKNAGTIYLGTAQGGIWKTIDSGDSWVPLTDHAPSLAIGALLIDPNNSNILYAGTGEGNRGGSTQYGLGILKTADAGSTWENKAFNTFKGSRFSRLAINPNDTSIIFAALFTRPGAPPPQASMRASGIYRSNDSGENWTRLENGLPPISSTGASDIVIDPHNPDVAYAAFWDEGIFKTINANANEPRWTKLTSGLPTAGEFSRIVLGISSSSSNTLYAYMSNTPQKDWIIDKFYQTKNSGDNWQQVPINVTPSRHNGNHDLGKQGFYNLNVAVHPQNENVVYLSSISLWKAVHNSTSGTWSISNIGTEFHPDNHAFAFNPQNPENIYAGSDGGIYRSENSGTTWKDDINKDLCITQFEFMEQHPSSDKLIIAGTQDNGTIRYKGDSAFDFCDGGDGGFVCIDPMDPKNVWHMYFNLSPAFSTQEGNFRTWIDLSGTIQQNASNFYAPLTLDKANPKNIAVGGNVLYLDSDRGQDGWPEAMRINLGLPNDDFISAINYVNSNLIYVGTNRGRVYQLTLKNGEQWNVQAIQSPPFPERYIWDIATVPNTENTIIVIVSGFGTGHVFRGKVSSDHTAAWTDIGGVGAGKLPDNPTNALVIDENKPDTMYVGMDVGVFQTTNGGNDWIKLGAGLPNVQIYDMRLFSASRLLRAATHGRGIWQLKL